MVKGSDSKQKSTKLKIKYFCPNRIKAEEMGDPVTPLTGVILC